MTEVADQPRRYAERLTAALERRCHGSLLAAYLHGSAVLGGWTGARSDVDILFVAADDLPAPLVEAVSELLVTASAECPGRGLEASLVTAGQAAVPASPWPFVLHSSGEPGGQRIVYGTEIQGDEDLIMHYAVCRAAGFALLGPPPADLIGPLKRAEILRHLAAELEWGLGHAPECYAVLNACRAMEFLERGRIVGKLAGGRAALEQGLGPAGLISEALDQHQGRVPEYPPGPEAVTFVRRIAAELTSQAAGTR
jgi:hypothetical protein